MEHPQKLSPRLLAVARQVRTGSVAADVGTDHGYLACYLAWNGCRKVYASDLNPGPLEQAARTIQEHGLEKQVDLRLSNGVEKLPLEEITDVVVAGMGGDLILSIVEDPRLRTFDKKLILQPMTKPEVLRRGLYRLGFELCGETAVEDGRFVYTVLTAQYSGRPCEIDDCFAYTGLLSGRTREERKYLQRVCGLLRRKISGLQKAGTLPEDSALERLLKQIEGKIQNDQDQ